MPLIITARIELPNKNGRGGCPRAGSKQTIGRSRFMGWQRVRKLWHCARYKSDLRGDIEPQIHKSQIALSPRRTGVLISSPWVRDFGEPRTHAVEILRFAYSCSRGRGVDTASSLVVYLFMCMEARSIVGSSYQAQEFRTGLEDGGFNLSAYMCIWSSPKPGKYLANR
jgi:hypothetical protein